MSNKCNTLFVFEGETTEGNIASKLEKYFMGESLAIKCAFCGDIYQFYRKLKAEEFSVEILTMLKQRNEKNSKTLEGYDNDSFAYRVTSNGTPAFSHISICFLIMTVMQPRPMTNR